MEACDMDRNTLDAMREIVARNIVQLCKDMGIERIKYCEFNRGEYEVVFADFTQHIFG